MIGFTIARSTIGDVTVRMSLVPKYLGAKSLAPNPFRVCVYPIGCPQEPIHIDVALSESVAWRQYRIACEAARRAEEDSDE